MQAHTSVTCQCRSAWPATRAPPSSSASTAHGCCTPAPGAPRNPAGDPHTGHDGRRLVLTGPVRGDTPPQPTGDDHEAGAVECTGHRDELGEYLHAVAAGLEHRDHATQLALGPMQPLDHVAQRVPAGLREAAPSQTSMSPTYPWGYTFRLGLVTNPTGGAGLTASSTAALSWQAHTPGGISNWCWRFTDA
jgi:hypothetical protein